MSVSFDNHIGHDWIEDFSDRYDFYHTKEDKIPFDLEHFNKITKGGLSKDVNSLGDLPVTPALFLTLVQPERIEKNIKEDDKNHHKCA